MAANTSPIFGLAANLSETTILPADTTVAKTVWTPDATNGGVLAHLNVCSDDSADHICEVYANDGSTDYLLGTVDVPDLSGTNGATDPAVDLIDQGQIPGVGGEGLFLPGGYSVKVAVQTTVTAAKTVTVIGIGFDY